MRSVCWRRSPAARVAGAAVFSRQRSLCAAALPAWGFSWAAVASGGGWRQRLEAREGGGELAGPGPAGLEAQRGAARVEGQPSGRVQQPVAQRLGFAAGERAVEAQRLRPDAEVLG